MAPQADDHVDVCCQIPDEAVAADSTDTTMFGTTSLLSFSGLVENVLLRHGHMTASFPRVQTSEAGTSTAL